MTTNGTLGIHLAVVRLLSPVTSAAAATAEAQCKSEWTEHRTGSSF